MKAVLGTRAITAQESIAALTGQVRDPLELLDEVRRRVDRVVPNEGGGWMLTDPQTLLPTALTVSAQPAEMCLQFCDYEFRVPDFNSFRDMHRRGATVATLGEATGGRLELSPRYRDVHKAYGLGQEARVLFRTGDAVWASACFSRLAGEPDFDADERAWLAAIAPEVGRGLRAALAHRPAEPAPACAPGMLVLDELGRVEYTTGAADCWLAHMPDDPHFPLNPVVLGVAMQARAEALAAAPGLEAPAQARLRVDTGAWLYVHAAALRNAAGEPVRTAVMLEPADRTQLLPLLGQVYGLTTRERDVVELLLGGLPTEDVAGRLHISRHTVRDHVKAIFGKVGVGSRAELTARFHPTPA